MCPCAPLVILAETHLQSLLCLGPCIYHDFGQYNAFAVQLMRCFRILADAILSIIFVQSAEIRWPDVIGHLYTSGLAMLSEILTEWVAIIVAELTFDQSNRKCSASLMVSPITDEESFEWVIHLNFRRCLK